MNYVWPQALAALTLEAWSLSMLSRSSSEAQLASFFATHALASALATSVAWILMPKGYKSAGNRWAIALVFCMAYFAPGIGVLTLLIVVHFAARFPKGMNTDRYVEIDAPQYVANEKDEATASDLRAGYARRILASHRESVDTKLRVLLALQDMRPKVAIPMLQGLLGDPAEDIRLLAYSMMDAWEKDITSRLQDAQAVLDGLAEPPKAAPAVPARSDANAQRFNAHRRLAELYWEQVDTKLARGDLRAFALQHAKKHCEDALELQPHSTGVWLLFGVVLAELGMADVAKRSLRAARAAGADAVRLNQLSARLAFEQGDYERVRELMREVDASERVPYGVRQVARFWAGKSVDISI